MRDTQDAAFWAFIGIVIALIVVAVMAHGFSREAASQRCQAAGGEMVGSACFDESAVIFK